jgi:DNA-binding response OmpR family regulator
MASILLVSGDRMGRDDLAAKLRARGHSVILTCTKGLSVKLAAHLQSVEIVIFDVTALANGDKETLRQLCQFPRQDSCPALVLCYSRIDRGPHFELALERLGVRYVYAG